MIFNLYDRFKVKLGDEEYAFDRKRLMFTEVADIEKATGLSYAEWERELARYSITAVAALLHVLRKREGVSSDFAAMQFNAAELDVVPVREDGTELTPAEITADLVKRMADAGAQPNGAGPTRAAAGPGSPSGGTASTPRQPTSPSSPPVTTSGPGSGPSSRIRTGSSSKRTPTHT